MPYSRRRTKDEPFKLTKANKRTTLLRECRRRKLPVSSGTPTEELKKLLTGKAPKFLIRKWSKIVTSPSQEDAMKLIPNWVQAYPIRTVRYTKMTAAGEKNKAWLVVEYEVPLGT